MVTQTLYGILEELCGFTGQVTMLFYVSSAAFGLMLLWLPFVNIESATGVIVVINLVVSTSIMVVSGSVIRFCTDSHR